ncbi:hypothetical protein SPH9361_02893 [Sphingobium sp. CECT 9361]|nr:hypothetical protein SPH9361_02893 [Sphingobium sp. CECT 9361]
MTLDFEPARRSVPRQEDICSRLQAKPVRGGVTHP